MAITIACLVSFIMICLLLLAAALLDGWQVRRYEPTYICKAAYRWYHELNMEAPKTPARRYSPAFHR